MNDIDLFLKALTSALKQENIHFVPRWNKVRDSQFPAYTTFSLEVVVLKGLEKIHIFSVKRTENTASNYLNKEYVEQLINNGLMQQIMEDMLKYYLYGDAVQ